jgi:hypothetical protein
MTSGRPQQSSLLDDSTALAGRRAPDRDPQLARHEIVQIATADEVIDVPQLLDPTLDAIHQAATDPSTGAAPRAAAAAEVGGIQR